MNVLSSFNMDRHQRVVIDTTSQQWLASPSAGVWRIPLEREAAESGQVTSLVRYEPDTHFSAHYHPNGEEIFVIDGLFQDEQGDYPAGTYIRNPPGSFHAPGSDTGCLLYVKLNMFPENDSETFRLDTHNANWQPGMTQGVFILPLHGFSGEQTMMQKWQSNTFIPPHQHDGGEEIFILSGEFYDELGEYEKGTWIRNQAGSTHQPATREGCLMLVKTGHF
ncbi:cupin domain-containing protein [uncultured Photobacterium sp.]|uniref:cupin domain-containing protein n=1 Tax=uncultured Photobacterium sp. TaxID=173973 RepID=UPI0026268475|nr:cupin domain-containing protein [uncultured Photobacterium sp.]